MHPPAKSPHAGFVASAVFCAVTIFSAGTRAQTAAPKCPPVSTVKVAHNAYGTADVADPYQWLEDQNSPETRAWIDAEQKCTETALSPLAGRAAIAKRIGELLRTDTLSTPSEHGGRYFFTKRLPKQELRKGYFSNGGKRPARGPV